MTVPCRHVGLAWLPEPDCLEYAWEQTCVCVIRNDGGLLAPAVARQLVSRGWRVVILEMSDRTWGDGVPSLPVDLASPTAWDDVLRVVADRYGRLAAWIEIHPRDDDSPADLLSSEREDARLK